jgi:hypothetical protein
VSLVFWRNRGCTEWAFNFVVSRLILERFSESCAAQASGGKVMLAHYDHRMVLLSFGPCDTGKFFGFGDAGVPKQGGPVFDEQLRPKFLSRDDSASRPAPDR